MPAAKSAGTARCPHDTHLLRLCMPSQPLLICLPKQPCKLHPFCYAPPDKQTRPRPPGLEGWLLHGRLDGSA